MLENSNALSASLGCSPCPRHRENWWIWLKRGIKLFPPFVVQRLSEESRDQASHWIDGTFGNRVAATAVRNFSPKCDFVVSDHLLLEIQLDVSIFSVKHRISDRPRVLISLRTQSYPVRQRKNSSFIARSSWLSQLLHNPLHLSVSRRRMICGAGQPMLAAEEWL